MSLTTRQRKRAAKEARKLALEIVAGTALPFGEPRDAYSCPAARVAQRSGFGANGSFGDLADEPVVAEAWIVAHAFDGHGPEAAVFPLLALASALDEQP